MIFGTFCIVMTFWVFFLYPETAGKSLEEIDYVFQSKIPAWKSGKAVGTFEDRVREVEQKYGHRAEVTHEEAAPAATVGESERGAEQV